MNSFTLKPFCMQSKNRQQLFTMQLLLLALICHIGSYFLPTTDQYDSRGELFGVSLWNEVILYSLQWEPWRKYGHLLIGIYLPPFTLVSTIIYWCFKRRIPSTFLLILGLLVPNFIIPSVFVYRQYILKEPVPIIWGYYAWALSYGLFFWSLHHYKTRRVRRQTPLFDHLIEDKR